MHILQSRHKKINEKEAKRVLENLNISKEQLPKISSKDPGLTENCNVGDIIRIERKDEEPYFRVVI